MSYQGTVLSGRRARCVLYFAAVAVLLATAGHLPLRVDLAAVGLAALAAGAWCANNFRRCARAHCLVTAAGWLGLAAAAFIGAGLGHSVLGGYEEPVFFAVLAAGYAFELAVLAASGRTALAGHRGSRWLHCPWPGAAVGRWRHGL